MDYIKKTILLTNEKKEICVLNIVKTNAGVFANIRNYSKMADDCILGITVDGVAVYKQNIVTNKYNGYDFKLSNDFNLNSKIGCVLIDKNSQKPIVWGVNGDIVNYKGVICEYIANTTAKSNVSHISSDVSSFVTTIDTDYNTKSDVEADKIMQDIDQSIDNTYNVDQEEIIDSTNTTEQNQIDNSATKIENYGVRDNDIEALSTKAKLFESEDVDELIDSQILADGDFFDLISEQIDDLFEKYPAEEDLERIVPNSKWVRVDYEGSDKSYVIGLIYEMEVLKYVAYGVPATSSDISQGIDEYSQWLPIDPANPDGKGYFVIYQDAVTGKSIRLA